MAGEGVRIHDYRNDGKLAGCGVQHADIVLREGRKDHRGADASRAVVLLPLMLMVEKVERVVSSTPMLSCRKGVK